MQTTAKTYPNTLEKYGLIFMQHLGLKNIKNTKHSKVFNLTYKNKDTKFRAKVEYSNGKIIHYPFRCNTEGKATMKYTNIKKITFLHAEIPRTGVATLKGGFGFTKPKGLHGLLIYLQSKYPIIDEVTIIKSGRSLIKKIKYSFLWTI